MIFDKPFHRFGLALPFLKCKVMSCLYKTGNGSSDNGNNKTNAVFRMTFERFPSWTVERAERNTLGTEIRVRFMNINRFWYFYDHLVKIVTNWKSQKRSKLPFLFSSHFFLLAFVFLRPESEKFCGKVASQLKKVYFTTC